MSSLALVSAAGLPDIRDTFGAVYIGGMFNRPSEPKPMSLIMSSVIFAAL
jgi:hypothetical protein